MDAETVVICLDATLLLVGVLAFVFVSRALPTAPRRGLLMMSAGLILLGVVHALETIMDTFELSGHDGIEVSHRLLVMTAFSVLVFGLVRTGRGLVVQTNALAASTVEMESRTREAERLSSILEITTDFVGIADLSGHAIYVNRAGMAMVGLPPGTDVSTLQIAQFHPPGIASRVIGEAIPTAAQYGSWRGETELRSVDGDNIPVSQVILAHRGTDGELAFFSTVARDMRPENELFAARAKAERVEQALWAQQRERDQLSLLADSMASALIMISARDEITYSSGGATTLLRSNAGALRGQPSSALELVLMERSDDPAAVREALSDLRRAETNWRSIDIVLSRPEPATLRCVMFPVLDSERSELGTGVLLSDVTAEAEVDRMKDEFIGVVSHELRTPLTGIMGFSELLCANLPGDSDTASWANAVHEESRRLAIILSDLLDVTRLDGGRDALKATEVAVVPCVQGVIERARFAWPRRDISLVGDDSIMLETDEGRLIQVMTNLIDNALKYSSGDAPVEVALVAGRSALEISVTDHGVGIAADQLGLIFSKFHRVDPANARVRGTGLGLYISERVVNLMGGQISVASELGRGSIFTVILPLAPGAQLEAA